MQFFALFQVTGKIVVIMGFFFYKNQWVALILGGVYVVLMLMWSNCRKRKQIQLGDDVHHTLNDIVSQSKDIVENFRVVSAAHPTHPASSRRPA